MFKKSPERIPNRTQQRQRTVLARAALLEIVVFIATAVAIDTFALSGDRFWSVHPSPFWLLVVAIAAQYGTNEAIAAAFASAGAYLSGELPAQAFEQDRFEYLFMLAKLPILWLLTAVGIGELTVRHRTQKQAAEERADRERGRADDLSEIYEHTRTRLERLEEHVAAELRSAASILAASARLDQRRPGQALLDAVQTLGSLFKAERFSFALLHDGALQIVIQEGWDADNAGPTHFGPDSRLFQAVVGDQRALTATEPDDAAILDQEGVMAVPMRDPVESRVIGMLKVEAMPFKALNFAAIEMITAMGDWIGSAYAQAERHRRSADTAMVAADLSLHSEAFLRKQRDVLSAIARRAGFSLSLVRIRRAPGAEDISTSVLAEAVAGTLDAHLRHTDMAFQAEGNGGNFVVILPLAGIGPARQIAERLRRDVLKRLGRLPQDESLAVSVEGLVTPETETTPGGQREATAHAR